MHSKRAGLSALLIFLVCYFLKKRGRFYCSFFFSSPENVTVQVLLKLIHICQSYCKKIKRAHFYGPQNKSKKSRIQTMAEVITLRRSNNNK